MQFVAHPNCQQHLVNVFYGREMRFLQSLEPWQKVLLSIVFAPLLPFVCLIYVVTPRSRVCASLSYVFDIISNCISHHYTGREKCGCTTFGTSVLYWAYLCRLLKDLQKIEVSEVYFTYHTRQFIIFIIFTACICSYSLSISF